MADSLTTSRTGRLPYWIKIGLVVIGFMLFMSMALYSEVNAQPVDNFTITETTEYGITANTVNIIITNNIGKDYTINISNIFLKHSLTEQITYDDVLILQTHDVDIYGWDNISQVKYETSWNETIDDYCWNDVIEHNETCYGFIMHYYDDSGTEMNCDYVLDDKSCMKAEWVVIGTEQREDYLPIPELKRKVVIDGKNIEQKQDGIPLPKDSTVRLKFTLSHGIFGPGFSVPDDVNKYNITVCSTDGRYCSTLDPIWWDGNWDYRRLINITNNNATATLVTGYSINFTFDTTGTKFLDNGDDVRIIYTNSTGNNELDRINTTDFNTTSTEIWFKLQNSLAGGRSNDTDYYVYYGNSGAGSPSIEDTNVFIIWDDFEGHGDGDVPDGWANVQASTEQAVSGITSINYTGGGSYLVVRDFEDQTAGMVRFEFYARPDADPVADDTWILPTYALAHLISIYFDDAAGTGDTIRAQGTGVVEIDGDYSTQWYKFVIIYYMDADTGDVYLDDVLVDNDHAFGAAGQDLKVIYMLRNHVWYDDFMVRKYITPVPTVSLGSEEISSTSLLAINTELEDFSFSDSEFVDASIINFNTSAPNTTFMILSSMNIEKLSAGGTNVITTRIILDSVDTILEEDIRTVSGTGDIGSSGTSPVIFSVASGQHNITYQFKRSGPGNINISNFDFNMIQFISSDGTAVRNQLILTDYNHTDTSFTTAFNWTMNKTINSSTFILVRNSLTKSGTGSTTGTYFFENLETGDTSPFWQRFLSDSSDIGSVSGIYIDPSEIGEHNHSIQSRQTDAGDVVFVNGSLVDFDLVDSDELIISFFQVSNESTNLTDSLTLVAGTHLLAEFEVLNNEGNSYFIAFFSSFSSTTGSQTPRYFIDSPNLTTEQCFTEKERTLSDNNDIGNAFAYTICEGLSVDEIYTFRFWVEVGTGETLTQLDENLLGFETLNFSITEGQVAPIASEITNPINGTNVSGSDTITWLPFFDPNDDLVTYNVTLFNPDGTHNTTIGLTNSTSLGVNWNSFQVGQYFLQVEGCDPGGLCDDTNISIRIVAVPTPELEPSINFCEDSDIFRTETNVRTITDGNTSDETTITRTVCQYGCFNVTLSNWGNAGCIESDFSLSLLLIAVVLVAVFSIRRVI